jgi:hypothetical protein
VGGVDGFAAGAGEVVGGGLGIVAVFECVDDEKEDRDGDEEEG